MSQFQVGDKVVWWDYGIPGVGGYEYATVVGVEPNSVTIEVMREEGLTRYSVKPSQLSKREE